MSFRVGVAALSVCMAICVISPVAAQTTDSAGFIVRGGADTVVIERSRRSGDTLSARLLNVRGGRTRFAFLAGLEPDALISRLQRSRPGLHRSARVPPVLVACRYTTTDRASDVRAALAFLRARPDIDSTRLGLIGISEGGLIGPMVAATDTLLNGIVLMAAPAESGRAIAAYQHRFQIARDSTIPVSGRRAALQKLLRATDSIAEQRPWLREILDYVSIATARRVRSTPVLILQGSTDQSIPPRDARLLATAFRAGGNRDVTLRMLPGLDHIFVRDSVGDINQYALFPSMRVPPDVLGLITDWTVQRLGTSVPKTNLRSNQHE